MGSDKQRIDLLQGTLDMLILRTLLFGRRMATRSHTRSKKGSDEVLQVEHGSLYPALHRLVRQGLLSAKDGVSENNRKAKFYSLTAKGHRQLTVETSKWDRMAQAIAGIMKPARQANAELAPLGNRLATIYPATNRGTGIEILTELTSRIGEAPDVAKMAAMALTLSITVLFAACVNLVGLLSSRAPIRAREIALRLAIGANRARLIRQLVTENLMIAVAGGAVGIAVGFALIRYLRRMEIPSDFAVIYEFHMDQRVLAVSFAAALLSVFVFGLMPAVPTVRTDLTTALKSAGAQFFGRKHLRGRNVLVVIQVAVALVLLTVAVAMYQGFRMQYGSGPGYRTDHLLMMSFDPGLIHRSVAERERFYREVLDRASGVPGIVSAALTSRIPMAVNSGNDLATILPDGYRASRAEDTAHTHFAAHVDENYFSVMAIPLLSGRGFRRNDDAEAPLVAVVNQAMASHYWPQQNAVGKRFQLNSMDGPWIEIVGVTPTSKYLWPGEGPIEFVYLPFRQTLTSRMTLVLQSSGDPAVVTAPLRQAVRSVDSEEPMYDVRTMADFYRDRVIVAGEGAVNLIGWLGVMGMVLSMVGLYGLVAYSVHRRTREIGIRMAVGATPGSVMRGVLGHGARLAILGVIAGLIASVGSRHGLAAVFPFAGQIGYGAYWLVAIALVAITMLAAYIPARRASQVDPTVALRHD